MLDATDHARSAAALRVDTHAAGLQEALWLTALHDKAPSRVWIVGTAAVDLGQKAGLSPEAERAVLPAANHVRGRIGVSPVPADTCNAASRGLPRT